MRLGWKACSVTGGGSRLEIRTAAAGAAAAGLPAAAVPSTHSLSLSLSQQQQQTHLLAIQTHVTVCGLTGMRNALHCHTTLQTLSLTSTNTYMNTLTEHTD